MPNRKAIILLGHIGSGKTSFFNKICDKKQKVQAGGDSVTRDVFMSTTAYGKGICTADTPGFGSDNQRLMHAASIKAGLSEQPLNRILILVKFDRIAIMKRYIREIVEIVQRYKGLITIVVTHWDKSENKAKDEKQLKHELLVLFMHLLNFILFFLYVLNNKLLIDLIQSLNKFLSRLALCFNIKYCF